MMFGFCLFGWILLGDERGRAFFPEAAAALCMPVPEVFPVFAANGPAFTLADPVCRVSFFAGIPPDDVQISKIRSRQIDYM